MTINWEFIASLEGRALGGYVPDPDNSRSGVTISVGFDLGQIDPVGLRKMIVDEGLANKLSPYAGLRGPAAVEYLRFHPLVITPPESDTIFQAVQVDVMLSLHALYRARWNLFPNAAQTVIASVFYQYGNLPKKTPRFFLLTQAQDWKRVVAELRDFGDRYSTRRNKEADYLENSLSRIV